MKTLKLSFILMMICSSLCAQSLVPIPQGFVDLGLPSGTRWHDYSETGLYSYQEAANKYKDRMPTWGQCEELINNCTWERFNTFIHITSKINGNSIYMYSNNDNTYSFLQGDFWTKSCFYYLKDAKRGDRYYYTIGWFFCENPYIFELKLGFNDIDKVRLGVHLVYNPQ